MLMSNEFVKAEDKYRRLLRDHYQSVPTGKVGRVIAALGVVGALFLAACGPPGGDRAPGTNETAATAMATEQGEAGDVTVVPAVEEMTPEEEFSGVPAPDWHPGYGRLPVDERAERTSGPR